MTESPADSQSIDHRRERYKILEKNPTLMPPSSANKNLRKFVVQCTEKKI